MNKIYHSSALHCLSQLDDNSVDLIYTDPPFGTQTSQTLERKKKGEIVSKVSYSDRHEDYLQFLRPHLSEYKRVLKSNGSLYLHLDYRWVHYAKVMLDEIFGRDCFVNEIIWSYDFGGRGQNCWPKKHDNILLYSKEPNKHIFNWDDIPRVPYKAPALQKLGRSEAEAKKRIELGKVPTDVWEMSIVGTASKERTSYPNQKPIKLIERAILASSTKNATILDTFAGSGSTGAAAYLAGRNFILSDISDHSIEVMTNRFKDINYELIK